jgi:hypothetical protein
MLRSPEEKLNGVLLHYSGTDEASEHNGSHDRGVGCGVRWKVQVQVHVEAVAKHMLPDFSGANSARCLTTSTRTPSTTEPFPFFIPPDPLLSASITWEYLTESPLFMSYLS